MRPFLLKKLVQCDEMKTIDFPTPFLSPILMLITKHIFCRYGGLIANLLQNNNPLPGKQADSTPVHPGVGIILFKKIGFFLEI